MNSLIEITNVPGLESARAAQIGRKLVVLAFGMIQLYLRRRYRPPKQDRLVHRISSISPVNNGLRRRSRLSDREDFEGRIVEPFRA